MDENFENLYDFDNDPFQFDWSLSVDNISELTRPEVEENVVDETRFPSVQNEELQTLQDEAVSTNTKCSTKTWLNVWKQWQKSRNLETDIEKYSPQELDSVLSQFYAEVRKRDGSEYEPDSLRVMQAALERHLKDHDYPVSIINDRMFVKSQKILDAKAKLLRQQGLGKRPNRAHSYTDDHVNVLWSKGLLGDQDGAALTYINFLNLSEQMGFQGRQDHYDAYVEDFRIETRPDGSKIVHFEENPTKTRSGGLRTTRRKSSQQMWSTDSGLRDPVRLFEEWLQRRPEALQNSGPLYLAIIPRPKTSVWYAKSRMGQAKLGNIMKSLAKHLQTDVKITNHSSPTTPLAKPSLQSSKPLVSQGTRSYRSPGIQTKVR